MPASDQGDDSSRSGFDTADSSTNGSTATSYDDSLNATLVQFAARDLQFDIDMIDCQQVQTPKDLTQ